jgi:hypothetical protein
MKTNQKQKELLRPNHVAVPFKLLLIDGESRNWVVCDAGEKPREKFHAFHGSAARGTK